MLWQLQMALGIKYKTQPNIAEGIKSIKLQLLASCRLQNCSLLFNVFQDNIFFNQ